MQTETIASPNRTAELTPPIRLTTPWRVKEVQVLSDYSLRVRFIDGLEGMVHMAELVKSNDAGVFAALADISRFQQATVSLGAVTWPNGLDLAPDAMYDAIKTTGEWHLQ